MADPERCPYCEISDATAKLAVWALERAQFDAEKRLTKAVAVLRKEHRRHIERLTDEYNSLVDALGSPRWRYTQNMPDPSGPIPDVVEVRLSPVGYNMRYPLRCSDERYKRELFRRTIEAWTKMAEKTLAEGLGLDVSDEEPPSTDGTEVTDDDTQGA